MAAYERITGVNLTEAAATIAVRRDRDTGRRQRDRSWRPGELTGMRRQAYNAARGAIAIGGHLGEPVSRLIDATGRPVTPTPPDEQDVAQLENLVTVLTVLDLRHGGGLTSQASKAILRWAVVMLDAALTTPENQPRLARVISKLAHRAGWAAYDVAAHEAARSLFRLALYTAHRAGDPHLRGHILADVAAQHNQLGYHHDALAIIRLGEGDERTAPPVRMLLHTVKARAYAALGETDQTMRQIDQAETIHANPDPHAGPQPGWVATLLHPGHLAAATGHAVATLAAHTTTETHVSDARRRLTEAVAALDPDVYARAHTLAAARLAMLQLAADDLDAGANSTRHALQAAGRVRSARVLHALATLRTIAQRHPHQRATAPLVAEITHAIGPEEPTDPDPNDQEDGS